MKPSFFNLIQAVRDLKLKITDKNGVESIYIELTKESFPQKLINLQKQLEALDNDESISKNVENSTIEMYKNTLEALIEMIKSKTDDPRATHQILEDAVKNYSVDKYKRDEGKAKSFNLKPSPKKKGDGEIKLSPLTQVPGTMSLEKHAQVGYRSEMALSGMGSAIEDLNKYKERAHKKAMAKHEAEKDDTPDHESPKI